MHYKNQRVPRQGYGGNYKRQGAAEPTTPTTPPTPPDVPQQKRASLGSLLNSQNYSSTHYKSDTTTNVPPVKSLITTSSNTTVTYTVTSTLTSPPRPQVTLTPQSSRPLTMGSAVPLSGSAKVYNSVGKMDMSPAPGEDSQPLARSSPNLMEKSPSERIEEGERPCVSAFVASFEHQQDSTPKSRPSPSVSRGTVLNITSKFGGSTENLLRRSNENLLNISDSDSPNRSTENLVKESRSQKPQPLGKKTMDNLIQDSNSFRAPSYSYKQIPDYKKPVALPQHSSGLKRNSDNSSSSSLSLSSKEMNIESRNEHNRTADLDVRKHRHEVAETVSKGGVTDQSVTTYNRSPEPKTTFDVHEKENKAAVLNTANLNEADRLVSVSSSSAITTNTTTSIKQLHVVKNPRPIPQKTFEYNRRDGIHQVQHANGLQETDLDVMEKPVPKSVEAPVFDADMDIHTQDFGGLQINHKRQKSQEEIECDDAIARLANELKEKDDELSKVISPPTAPKTTTDYVDGLFQTDVDPARDPTRKRSQSFPKAGIKLPFEEEEEERETPQVNLSPERKWVTVLLFNIYYHSPEYALCQNDTENLSYLKLAYLTFLRILENPLVPNHPYLLECW